jgi:Protein of unknown function (DUF1573)
MLSRKFAALLLLLALPTLVSAGNGPKISFEKTEHDYGKVLYGDTVTTEFVFTNEGDETLVIEKLHASCGCTKALIGSKEIPPKGGSKIRASFDTIGLRAGKKKKTVYVHTNDPKAPRTKLHLYADVVRHVSVAPARVAKKLKSFQEVISFPLTAKNASDKTVTITGAKLRGSGAKVSLEPGNVVVPPNSKTPFKIVLHLKKEKERFFYMGRVVLTTNHPREHELLVRYLVKLE